MSRQDLDRSRTVAMDQWAGLLSKVRRARSVGALGIAQRVAQRTYAATGAGDLRFNLDFDDILTDVPTALPTPSARPERGRPITVGWVMTPPAAGSGGHTTLF